MCACACVSAVKCVGCREAAYLAQGEVLSEDVLSVVSSKMNSAISILIYLIIMELGRFFVRTNI